ncbi:patatin-like phospholipase family protein [Reinekea marinisedimentorum]|uniref:Putative acylesterase/phospholipase RssA n=1 Tax=Reinekea marinisedimentorum TaxID=230495 RepID=A0A4R3I9E3_9GAMM|nr:patatin-like phospholipase family protein [Reinekea marinisedimentorum]TCS41990.1 putative acylesterase/phospholipase RssA [Reinekea marinisedimentorum]
MVNHKKTIALALAGGGPLGGLYELGALMAIQQALPTLKLHQLPMYVGVSAGSVIASALANNFAINDIAKNLLRPQVADHPIHPSLFYKPAWKEYMARLSRLPALSLEAVSDYFVQPDDETLLESFTRLKRLLPSGFFNNQPIEQYLRNLFEQQGVSNDFRQLNSRLMVVAADLDKGNSVVFGQHGWDDVPISVAVQASTAVPGLYLPVKIHDRYFVDGVLYKTVHASAAIDAGADLVICINPVVPYENNNFDDTRAEQTSIKNEGSIGIISQALRALVHSRSTTGFRQYDSDYPDKDILLFEPSPTDAEWFFTNEFSFKNRSSLVEKAYKATLQDLAGRREALNEVLAGYRLEITEESLVPNNREILECRKRRRKLSPHMLQLRKSLNKLEQQLEEP